MQIYYNRNDLRNDKSDKRTHLCIDFLIDKIGTASKNIRNLTVIKKNSKTFSNIEKLAFDDKYYVNEIVYNNVKRKP